MHCFLCLVNRNCPVFGEQKLWRLCALFPVFGELKLSFIQRLFALFPVRNCPVLGRLLCVW